MRKQRAKKYPSCKGTLLKGESPGKVRIWLAYYLSMSLFNVGVNARQIKPTTNAIMA